MLRNITMSETKYFYVMSSLDAETSVRMAPLLQDLRTPYSYAELKQLLLDTYRLTEDEQAHAFSCITELGDCKPSQVMDQMILLHGRGWD